MIPAASVTGRTATAHRSIPASVSSGTFRQSLVILTLICACLPQVRAVIPNGTTETSLYKQGYLDVTRYTSANGTPTSQWVTKGDTTNSTTITRTTAGLNQAIKDAYAANLALYFPSGTYVVNNTLVAHTETGTGGPAWNTPNKHIAIIGQKGARPVIKLATVATGFNDPTTPKAVVEFMNFEIGRTPDKYWESPATGFGQMIRDVIIDCSHGLNDGAIGLYFNQAQTSSIENVKVIATGALSGITGLPGRSWGAVNIEVVGGQYGIDTNPIPRPENPVTRKQTHYSTTNAGSVIVGAKLTNQAISALRIGSFVPVVLVGFDITTSINQPVMTMQPRFLTGDGAVSLIDGKITRTGSSSSLALINNSSNNNLYLRNVHMTGSDNLVDNGAGNVLTGSNIWKHINEYSYTASTTVITFVQDAINLVDGEFPLHPPSSITSNAISPPNDLRTKHFWTELPAMTDSNVVDVTTLPFDERVVPAASETDLTTVVSHLALQAIINANSSPNPQNDIFLPKGIYRLTGPIILRANTVLFGAGRQLTRIEVAPSFPIMMNGSGPTETPIITTVDDPDATTYLGDLTIGVDVGLPKADDPTSSGMLARDWFVALHWKAGRKSMVHMGQPYRVNTSTNREATNAHSLMKITHNGGGRWYFAGAIKTRTGGHTNYRILKVNNTSQALSIYGLNVEHPGGEEDFSGLGGTFLGTVAETSPTTFTEFYNATNIRIYGVKSEFSAKDGQPNPPDDPVPPLLSVTGPLSPAGNSRVASFVSCQNIAVFGPGAIRNSVFEKGVFEFNSTCDRVLATQITPHQDRFSTSGDDTLRAAGKITEANDGVTYPNVVALFKRGVILTADEAAMNHN